MDNSASILSGQYNDKFLTAGKVSDLRGSGKFTTKGMSSNYYTGDKSLWKPHMDFPTQSKGWSVSEQAPVGKRVNNIWGYSSGDPYQQFALKTMKQVPTPLLNTFFNRSNVKYLGKRIIEEIKRITGHKIKEQSEDALLVIMQEIYEYALSGFLPQPNDPHLAHSMGSVNVSLKDRLTRLNQAVLQKSVKEIVSGINMYLQYTKDASSIPMPLSLPISASSKGGKVLSQNVGMYSGKEETRINQSYNLRHNVIN
jgi:hypothetical protein